ncbi:MAG: superoxide dismutase family protein [Flavobacteriales bacterium AspAUS03]
MKSIYLSSVFVAMVSLSSCKTIAIALINPLGKDGVTGQVKFVQERNGKVYMTTVINGSKSGVRAMHIHEKGDCSTPDGTSAGGHWNPLNHKHGKWGKDEFHKGDIGNVWMNVQGKGFYGLVTDKWCVGCPDVTKNIVGKAIIVHEKVDNFITQPTGAAGSRKGCGVIRIK